MSLVALPPDPASPDGSTVAADSWFPPIDCNACRKAMRIGKVVTHERLRFAIVGALLSVMGELAAWKAARVADGAADLDAVAPGEQVGGQTRLAALFARAVYTYAAADIAEHYRDLSATDEGDQRAEEIVPAAADYRRMSTLAIRDILGVTRTAIELI